MNGVLQRLYFGRDDAERDMAEGLLQAGFLRTAVYDEARTARKPLIIGRKGSGKSAICRTLVAETDPRLATVLVTPDKLSADALQRFELQGMAPEHAKGLIWRYILAVEVAKHLVLHAKVVSHGKASRTSVEALHKFLVANGELDEQRPQFWQVIQRLKGSLSLDAFGIVKTSIEITGPSEGIRTKNQLEVIERNVVKAIDQLTCPDDHQRLLILVDQIEDVWQNDSDSDKLVIGLLEAISEISVRFRRVACVVFLRSDIYDLLQWPDKDKYRSLELHIQWDAESLTDLIYTRARASLGHDIAADDLWRGIFPGQVGNVGARDFVISHTLMRPRDVIHLCNLCRDIATQKKRHATIRASDMTTAIARYSRWKLQDLANEYLINYPFLSGLLGMFRDSGYLVGRAALEKRFAASLDSLRERFPERAQALTPDAVLAVLYDIGFLGIRRNDHVIYAYENEDRVELTDEFFCIHPCFRYALRAELPTASHPFEPEQLAHYVVQSTDGHFEGNAAPPFSGSIQRGSLKSQLLTSVSRQLERAWAGLPDSGLPSEIREDIVTNLHRIMNATRDLRDGNSEPSTGAVVRHVMDVATFLVGFSSRLEENGFGADSKSSTFIRTLGEIGERLSREAAGTTRT